MNKLIKNIDEWQKRRQKLFKSTPAKGVRSKYLGKEFIVYKNTFRPFEDSIPLVKNLKIKKGEKVLDVGTGSGVIAIFACYKGAGSVVAIDVNPDAVRSAKANVKLHNFTKKIKVFKSNLFADVPKIKFDVITFNPPFRNKKAPDIVASSQWDTNLSTHKKFFREVGKYLKNNGHIYIAQANFGAKDEMCKLAEKQGFKVQLIGQKKKYKGEEIFYAFILTKIK